MEISSFLKPCLTLLLLLIFHVSTLHIGQALPTAPVDKTEATTKSQQQPMIGVPESAKNAQLPDSLFPTPAINHNIPFERSRNNQGQEQSLMPDPQQAGERNYPQRIPNQQPLSGLTQPFSLQKQPVGGVNNQQFGARNQRGFTRPINSGVADKKGFLIGAVLINLIATLGFTVY